MKFSEQWLRSWANPAADRDALVAKLSMVGLEVDSVTPVAGAFHGVVVGEIALIGVVPAPLAEQRPCLSQPVETGFDPDRHARSPCARSSTGAAALSRSGNTGLPVATRQTV